MAKLRVALIGNGGICRGSHIENYYEDNRVEVVAFCDIIEERAIALRDKYYPEAAVYTDYKELLKDKSIDAVDICTPNYLHSIIAVDAFKALKKNGDITEDDLKDAEKDIQKMTDDYCKEIDVLLEKKEKELLAV